MHPAMGRWGTPGEAGGSHPWGHPRVPFSRFSRAPAANPTPAPDGGGNLCSGDPHELSFGGGRSPSCSFGNPKRRAGSSIPQIPAALGDCSCPRSQKTPRDSSPLPTAAPKPRLRGGENTRGGKLSPPLIPQPQEQPWNFIPCPFEANSLLSPLPKFPLGGLRWPLLPEPRLLPGNRELFQPPGAGGASGACSASPFFFLGGVFNGLFPLREAPAAAAGRGAGEPRLCGAGATQRSRFFPGCSRSIPPGSPSRSPAWIWALARIPRIPLCLSPLGFGSCRAAAAAPSHPPPFHPEHPTRSQHRE